MLQVLTAWYEAEWFTTILIALAAGLASLIGIVFQRLIKWLSTLTKDEKLNVAICTVIKVVEDSVMYIQQTQVDTLKKEGKFTPEKQKEALNMAVDKALANLGEEVIKIIEDYFGNITDYIKLLIESTIYKKIKTGE